MKGIGMDGVMKPVTLVLLPGMHGSGDLFAPLLRELPDYIRTLVLSYPPDQPLGYSGHLDVVMAALPDDRPFVLLGESFSGPLALMAAARHPKGLLGVILCATFVAWPLPFAPFIARLIVSLGVFGLKSTRLFQRVVLGRNATDELTALFSEAVAKLKPEVLAARAKAVMTLDCTAALRECRVPILAMVAKNDRILTEQCTKLIGSIRPDAEIVDFNSPHLVLQCAPLEAARQICRFVESVSKSI